MNRATQEVRTFCGRLIADPEYRANFEQRWRRGTLAPALEQMVWAYAAGKPQQHVEVTGSATLAELIVGSMANEEELDGDVRDSQPPVNGN